jgi:hypothetical protein
MFVGEKSMKRQKPMRLKRKNVRLRNEETNF